jgi:hypothetical protein
MARPTDYTQETALSICEQIADGMSLRAICLLDEMPAKSTVFKWLTQHQEFADQYAHAREAQADSLADEMLDIADDGSNDWMERSEKKGGGWEENGEAIGRSRLRLDARKWIASKLKPKKYGDRTNMAISDPNGDPVSLAVAFVASRTG